MIVIDHKAIFVSEIQEIISGYDIIPESKNIEVCDSPITIGIATY